MPTSPTLAQVQAEYSAAAGKANTAANTLAAEITIIQNDIEATKLRISDMEQKIPTISNQQAKDASTDVLNGMKSSLEEKNIILTSRQESANAWLETETLYTMLSTYTPSTSQGVQGV